MGSIVSIHRTAAYALVILASLVGRSSLRAADAGPELSYSRADAELERAFDAAGEDAAKQHEALMAHGAKLLQISQKYQGEIADKALIASAMSFHLGGDEKAAEKSLKAAAKRVKTWALQISLMQSHVEIVGTRPLAIEYAKSLLPEAKLSKSKANELKPLLQKLNMQEEIAALNQKEDRRANERKKAKAAGDAEKESEDLVAGSEAPDFVVRNFDDGFAFSLKDYRGKVVLLDFWATWCGPCILELPNLIRTYDKYNGAGFEIIGVSLDDMGTLSRFLKANPLKWKQVCDGKGLKGEVVGMYQIDAVPATFLIDGEGKIIAKGLKGEGLETELKKALAK